MVRYMKCVIAVVLAALCLAWGAHAAESFEMPVWPDGPPGGLKSTMQEQANERVTGDQRDRSLTGVTEATLTVYLPDTAAVPSPVVLVCPGGGFTHLAIDKEGHDIARWLNENGIAGVVLKYRLPDPDAGIYVRNGAVEDMHRALRIIRHRAAEWKIDPGKVGVMGFSAGGYLTALSGVLFDAGDAASADPVARQSCRPDFITPVYPLVSLVAHVKASPERVARMLGPDPAPDLVAQYSPETRVTDATPPAFIVQAHDDNLSSENSIAYYLALHEAGVSAELHIYAAGGHGFGIRKTELPVATWPARWLEWFQTVVKS